MFSRYSISRGSLASEEVKALNRAIFVFLGLAETEASQD
jgi:hypothetical protein